MGTTSKIIGALATAIDKVSGTAISGLANIMGQIISLYSDSAYVGEFDGTDDYVDCGNDSSIRPTTGLTYNCWVYKADWYDQNNSPYNAIMGNFKQSSGIYTRWKNRRIQAFARIDGVNRQIQTGYNKFKVYKHYYRASGWHMITVTWDGRYFKLYIDGALESSGGTPTVDVGSSGNVIDYSTGNYAINIGQQTQTGNFFDGKIDEVAIWNVALDADAIAELWDQDGGTVKPSNLNADKDNYDNSSALQGWWRFEENTGTSIADSSTNSNTATLVNGTAFSSTVPD